MITYIESIELIDEVKVGVARLDQKRKIIQEEITGKVSSTTIQSAQDKCVTKEEEGKTYKHRMHVCRHDEGLPCTVEEITQDVTPVVGEEIIIKK